MFLYKNKSVLQKSSSRHMLPCGVAINPDNLSVFQRSSHKQVSLYEIESSLITVQGMSDKDKHDYFESILIKYDNVDKYYNVVKTQ